jgi:PAS domain S-box-containing protein
MPRGAQDRPLRWLLLAFGLDTASSIVLALTGVIGRSGEGSGVMHVRGLLGLVWFVLLAAVFWRAARYVRRLRGMLDARDEQMAVAAATSHDWLWESDARMVATYCSPAVSAILGLTPDQIVGQSLFEYVCEDDRARLHDVTERALRNGTGWDDVEARWKHADGHLIVIRGSALPVHDANGSLIGFRGTRRVAREEVLEQQRLALVTRRVRQLLDDPGIAVALQPIITFDGRWTAVEALARFPDGRPPDLWFAEAAEAGLGVELELLAVHHALTTAATLPADVLLSLNASPALILDPRLSAVLTSGGVPLKRLVLELTEHSQIGFYNDIAAVLDPLRAQGLRLAIDDAGAGYASFAHVLQLRPDVIKLDRSLIAGIDTDPARRAFVTAIVLLGVELGSVLTGEGVETAGEFVALADLGVDHAQGYLIARPSTDPATWLTWRAGAWPVPNSDRAVDERPATWRPLPARPAVEEMPA